MRESPTMQLLVDAAARPMSDRTAATPLRSSFAVRSAFASSAPLHVSRDDHVEQGKA